MSEPIFYIRFGERFAPTDLTIESVHRLRISQLRRMVDMATVLREDLMDYRLITDAPIGSFHWRMARRKWWLAKFSAACLAEIERLRGEG